MLSKPTNNITIRNGILQNFVEVYIYNPNTGNWEGDLLENLVIRPQESVRVNIPWFNARQHLFILLVESNGDTYTVGREMSPGETVLVNYDYMD